MSNPEDRNRTSAADMGTFPRLEAAVEAMVGRVEGLRAELQVARSQASATNDLLRSFTAGEEDPSLLMTRLLSLEAENKLLLERLQEGRKGVERLLARIRFLEDRG